MSAVVPERLSSAHYAPATIPSAVRGFAGSPDTLSVGRPGKVGLLELGFERVGARTELVRRYQKSPLQIMRPLYVDPLRPDLPVVYLMSTGGGVVQADRLRLDVDCGVDTALHLTTQAATKVHHMDADFATQTVGLRAGPRAYLEYLPDALIPYPGARFYQHTTVTVDRTATVLIGEVLMAGRLARSEHHRYDVLATDLELVDPDDGEIAIDRIRFSPQESAVTGPGMLGGHTLMATLFVVSPLRPAAVVADTLHGAVADSATAGVSVLPGDRGAWVRILGTDSPTVQATLRHAWDAVRRLLIGVPAPLLRKT
ncbi:urease accessory protein UreD [Mycobacterium sp. MUNTM1]